MEQLDGSGALHLEKKAGIWTIFAFVWNGSKKKQFARICRDSVSMAVTLKLDTERRGMVRQYTYRTLKEIQWNSKDLLIEISI